VCVCVCACVCVRERERARARAQEARSSAACLGHIRGIPVTYKGHAYDI
jgi:hypothetical protein